MPKSKFGYMKCETRKCVNGDGGPGRVVVMLNEHGTLSYRCDECGASPYAHKGTGKYAAWERDSERSAAPPPEPKPAPEKKEPPAAPVKPARVTTLLG